MACRPFAAHSDKLDLQRYLQFLEYSLWASAMLCIISAMLTVSSFVQLCDDSTDHLQLVQGILHQQSPRQCRVRIQEYPPHSHGRTHHRLHLLLVHNVFGWSNSDSDIRLEEVKGTEDRFDQQDQVGSLRELGLQGGLRVCYLLGKFH